MATALKVQVVQAFRLSNVHPEKSKLVVVVEYKERCLETAVLREPKWGQTLEFTLTEKDRLSPGEVNVYIWNRYGKEEKFLGRATVSLMEHASVAFTSAKENRYDLVGSGAPKEKITGQIALVVGYVLPARRANPSGERKGAKQNQSAQGRKLAALGYYDPDERRNTEEILDDAHRVSEESVASVGRSLRMLEDASADAAETEAMLHSQRQQINNITAGLDEIQHDQDKEAKLLRSIDSAFGSVDVAVSGALSRVLPGSDRLKDTNKVADDRVRRDRRDREKKVRGAKGAGSASAEAGGGLTRDEMEVLRPETQQNVRTIDTGLDRMAYLLDDLGARAGAMGSEIQEQNVRLAVVRGSMDKTYSKSRTSAARGMPTG